jgi:hypothetical protein
VVAFGAKIVMQRGIVWLNRAAFGQCRKSGRIITADTVNGMIGDQQLGIIGPQLTGLRQVTFLPRPVRRRQTGH